MKRVGFLVNPIAGMGGRVGLKGTDGVWEEAVAMGAEPVAPDRARQALQAFAKEGIAPEVRWLTCGPPMGEAVLRDVLPEAVLEIVYRPDGRTSAEDTRRAAREMAEREVGVVLFCGGDGTARDVLDAVGDRAPLLGIPAGVKMHSGVFGVNPEAAAVTLARFLAGRLPLGDAEVLDLDEARYRRGEWSLELHGVARTPQEPNLVQVGKLMVQEVADEVMLEEMADYLGELMREEPEVLYVFGPGGTTRGICKHLGVEATLLGVDAVRGGEIVGRDLNEDGLLRLLEDHPEAELVVSPIGAQGFVLGRGNLQLSPAVLRKIGPSHLTVVATPAKLRATPRLRVDTGDADLDEAFLQKDHLAVVIGYRTKKLHPLGRAE